MRPGVPRTGGAVGPQPDAGPVRGEPPVRRQWHQTVAVGAGDRACPQVRHVEPIDFTLREQRAKAILDAPSPIGGQFFELFADVQRERRRPLDGGLHHKSRDRVEVVGESREASPECFERDAPATGGRIKNRHALGDCFLQPLPIAALRRVLEGALVAVRIVYPDACSSRPVDLIAGRHRIPVNPKHVQELLPVGVRW